MFKRTKPSETFKAPPRTRSSRARGAVPLEHPDEPTVVAQNAVDIIHMPQDPNQQAQDDITLSLDLIHVIALFLDFKTLENLTLSSRIFATGYLWDFVQVADVSQPKHRDQIISLVQSHPTSLRTIKFYPIQTRQTIAYDTRALISLFKSPTIVSRLTRLELVAYDGRLFREPSIVRFPKLENLRISCLDLLPIVSRPTLLQNLSSLVSLSLHYHDSLHLISAFQKLVPVVTNLRSLSIHNGSYSFQPNTTALAFAAISDLCLKNTALQRLSLQSRQLCFQNLLQDWAIKPGDPDVADLSRHCLESFGVDLGRLRSCGTSLWSYYALDLEKKLENPQNPDNQAPQQQQQQQGQHPPQNNDEDRDDEDDEPTSDTEDQSDDDDMDFDMMQNSFAKFEPLFQACRLTPAEAMAEIERLIRSHWRGMFDQNMRYVNNKILECLRLCQDPCASDDVAKPALQTACYFLEAKYMRKYEAKTIAAIKAALIANFRRIRFITKPRTCMKIVNDPELRKHFCKHAADIFDVRYLVDAVWKEPDVITDMAAQLFALPDRHSGSVIKRLNNLYKDHRIPHRTTVIKTVLKLLKGRLGYFAKLELVMMHRLCDTPIFFAYILAALCDDEDQLDRFLAGLFDRRAVNKPWGRLRVAITLKENGSLIVDDNYIHTLSSILWRLVILSASSKEFFTNDINEILSIFPTVPVGVYRFAKSKSSTTYETRIDPLLVKSVIREKIKGYRVQ